MTDWWKVLDLCPTTDRVWSGGRCVCVCRQSRPPSTTNTCAKTVEVAAVAVGSTTVRTWPLLAGVPWEEALVLLVGLLLSPAQCSTRGGRQLQRAGRLSAGDRGIQQGRQVPARPSGHGGGFFVVRPSVHCRCPISSLWTCTVPASATSQVARPLQLTRFHHAPLPRPAVHHLQSPPPLSSHLHFRFRRRRRRLASLIIALAPAPPPPPLTAPLLHTACPHSPSTTTTIHHQQRSWSFLRSAAQPRTTTQPPPIAHHTATPPHARTHHDDIRRPDRPICA